MKPQSCCICKDILLKLKVDPKKFDFKENVSNEFVAELLSKNNIIARCSGDLEFGARSLGNRAILAHPMYYENVEKINDLIKKRDFWMPFTPSFLEENINDYIINKKNIKSPYMTIAFKCRKEKIKMLRAVVHQGDKSTRPQTVSKSQNYHYWSLINEFFKITGIPCLLNTSLNLHGDPMNANVKQALNTFIKSELKYILLDQNILISKSIK